jgi:hypothetical protein
MNVSAIGSTAPEATLPSVQQATAAPAASKPADTPTDTVTLSPAALKASQAGDVDHDGDSH